MNKRELVRWLGIPVIGLLLFFRMRNEQHMLDLLLAETVMAFAYIAAAVDIREKRVPNGLVIAMLAAWVVILAPQLLVHTETALFTGILGLLGFLLGGVLFLIVYMVSRKGLGGGDVKFMAAAGLYLGPVGTLSAMLYGSVLAALACGVLLLLKKMKKKDTIPLVPFLFAGVLLVLFAG